MSITKRMDVLNEYVEFEHVEAGDKADIATALQEEDFKAGDVLMRQDEKPAAQRLLFVTDGECAVTLTLPTGEEVAVTRLKQPFYIGEAGLITGACAHSSCVDDVDI